MLSVVQKVENKNEKHCWILGTTFPKGNWSYLAKILIAPTSLLQIYLTNILNLGERKYM